MERTAYLYSDYAKRFLYHVTERRLLPKISKQGLRPRVSSIQGGRAVYLTEVAGLPMWWNWIEDQLSPSAGDATVVLRTPILDKATQLKIDEMGTRDAKHDAVSDLDKYFPKSRVITYPKGQDAESTQRYKRLVDQLINKAKAYKYKNPVPPQELQIWSGSRWVNISKWEQITVPYDVKALFSSLAAKTAYDPATLRKLAAPLEDEGFVGKRWGSQGAGLLLTTGKRVLLLKRSPYVEEPNTWGYPGGAVRRDPRTGKYDDLKKAAIREAEEEVGTLPPYRIRPETFVYSEPSFKYTTFFGVVSEAAAKRWVLPTSFDWESVAAGWFTAEELGDLDLHFGFAHVLATRPELVFFGRRA